MFLGNPFIKQGDFTHFYEGVETSPDSKQKKRQETESNQQGKQALSFQESYEEKDCNKSKQGSHQEIGQNA